MKERTRLPIWIACSVVAGILLGVFVLTPANPNGKTVSTNQLGYKFQTVLDLIEKRYVENVAIDSLTDDALRAIVQQLDPHSNYLTASELAAEQESMSGSFDGIGIRFRLFKDSLVVVQTVSEGPSEKAGLAAGDRIVAIDGRSAIGDSITQEDVLKRLKGPRGTQVKLNIFRPETRRKLLASITRDKIPSHSVSSNFLLNKNTGYIRLSRFTATTHREMRDAIAELKSEGMTQLILDLRGNGGGYLEQAVKLCDEFLPAGDQIVYTKSKGKIRDEYAATAEGIFETGKLLLLIDEYTASAGEIVSGALQDNDRATILGRRTFGKGLVQEQRELFDSSALRLTVARYYIPSGRCIQRPYIKGDPDAYYHDFVDRYQRGEFQGNDSVFHGDTTRYLTKKERIVYGGGGITPDVFIPYETSTNEPLYSDLLRRDILSEYCFNYTDQNRTPLKAYKTGKEFVRHFTVSTEMFRHFLAYAEQQGVNTTKPLSKPREQRIKTLMKAYIAQNLYESENTFYEIYLPIDPDMKSVYPLLP